MYEYKTKGVCSKGITFAVKDDKIINVEFDNGCTGNLKGIGTLVEGMEINDVVNKLKGIDCGGKGTSCPDQLARAIEELVTTK